MALPGTPGQRISDLCNGNHISQKQLAEKIGVSAFQLNRIVSGETKTVSSDILIGVAKGIMARNQLIELATASLSDLMERTPAGAAFYGRCNCYDCRTDLEVSSDGRGNGGTVPAVGKEDDGAGRKIIAEKCM